jgi:hypothetical protein
MGQKRQPWAKRNQNEWVCITHAEITTDAEMDEYPVIGAVPGTPAAEAETRQNAVNAAVLREKIRREEERS